MRGLSLKLFASTTSDQSGLKLARRSALISLLINSPSSSISSTGQGVDKVSGSVWVGSGLSGGGAKGSCDCRLLVQARFWAFFDNSNTEL